MNNPDLIKNFVPESAIEPYRIVTFGSDDEYVVQASASTDGLIGVSDSLGGEASVRVDVVMSDITEVEYGGAVTRGDLLTSDADGKAITASPDAGSNVRTIGTAMVSGVDGDIGSVFLNPSQIQG